MQRALSAFQAMKKFGYRCIEYTQIRMQEQYHANAMIHNTRSAHHYTQPGSKIVKINLILRS